MKLQFKHQAYQAAAVQAVVDCFKGQLPNDSASRYRIDSGEWKAQQTKSAIEEDGFKNADIQLSLEQVLTNLQQLQRNQNLPQSVELKKDKVANINLDIEMETGTGKTYCYLKSIFELNQKYGWSKFIIVVPSIAIREGVYKSLEITADHFLESYGKKARSFIYNSKQLHELENFSSSADIQVMVINVQAFNATGADNRRIYEELDDFQSRRPIDVIAKNRPILILDEPQKMEGKKTLESFANFNPLFIVRYSATHKTEYNKIYRLDALDAYNQKLVKKIAVRGISIRGLTGTNAYLYFEGIEISSTKPPLARLEFEVKQNTGIKRITRKLSKGTNLLDESNGLSQYEGFVISDINANTDVVSFTNGVELYVGDATGDVHEHELRRIQIRETIKAHFEKEQQLFTQGIKVLSLFFIDTVAKYRDYSSPDEKGDYARIFEEEYNQHLNEVLTLVDTPYNRYLKAISANKTHNGYFSIDKKSKRLVDPLTGKKSTEADDVDAYDLILKDKERLLSFDEPTRFIFSHSALREGWDNPNVFVICTLKHSDNTTTRRQEVGRGLRLAVNQHGERMDNPAIVHDINLLTVVASESYKEFVTALQNEIGDSLSARPRKANEAYFEGKVLNTNDGDVVVSAIVARQIYKYLLKNDYINDADDSISEAYHRAKKENELGSLPDDLKPYADSIFNLIDSVFSQSSLPLPDDGRRPKQNPRNANFDKKEFQALWQRINHKAVYTVQFDTAELVAKCVNALNEKPFVEKLQYTVQRGEQRVTSTFEDVKKGEAFKITETDTETFENAVHTSVSYDLIGDICKQTKLKRSTVAEILQSLKNYIFAQFKYNPEHFIAAASRIINEQKATVIVEHLTYSLTDQRYDTDIFTAAQIGQDFTKAGDKLQRHIYDYVITDSQNERNFVTELDTGNEVVVYAKLPKGFSIPTPVGDYNPDWAIAFDENKIKHIYFVAETKGSMSSMQLREIEQSKTACAKKFFDELNAKLAENKVRYEIVDSYGTLLQMVS
jgi:type III restriction enzyme